MEIIIIKNCISLKKVQNITKEQFGDIIKATIDVDKKIMALGGELHADEEALLLENGSTQSNLWGINIYPFKDKKEWVEFDSMINIRPRNNNMSRYVEDEKEREKIMEIIDSLILIEE